MKNKDDNINYKAFVPIGITFIGAGVTFMIAVNPPIGAGLIAVGVVFVIIRARKDQNKKIQ